MRNSDLLTSGISFISSITALRSLVSFSLKFMTAIVLGAGCLVFDLLCEKCRQLCIRATKQAKKDAIRPLDSTRQR